MKINKKRIYDSLDLCRTSDKPSKIFIMNDEINKLLNKLYTLTLHSNRVDNSYQIGHRSWS